MRMSKLRMGIMGCADIAWRAMIPAMIEIREIDLVAVASRTKEKASKFADRFKCNALVGYEKLLDRDDIAAAGDLQIHQTWKHLT